MKIRHHCAVYSTVEHTKAQPLVEDARVGQGTPHVWTSLRDWTWERTCVRIFESLQLEGLYVGSLLYFIYVTKARGLQKARITYRIFLGVFHFLAVV